MLRSAISAFTRVIDALWRCAADPGSILSSHKWVPALRSSVLDDATHRQENAAGNAAPRPGHDANAPPTSGSRRDGRKSCYFQTDLSASQRWALSAFASASTEPLSSFCSPSSSPLDSSVRLSFGPAVSSAVEMTGLPIHSNRRSDAPGLSGATRAESSIVSVRPSVGYIWLGRLNVNFSFPVLAFHTVEDDFADSVLDRTLAIAVASLSLPSLSPSRQSAAANRTERSISTTPLVQPAETTPGNDLNFAISAAARSGSTLMLIVCSPARSASQDTLRLLRETSTSWPFNPFRKSVAASSLTFTAIASGETSVKSFGAAVMPSSDVWLSWNSFSLRSELSVEVTSVRVWPTLI